MIDLTVKELNKAYSRIERRIAALIRDNHRADDDPEHRHIPPGQIANLAADLRAIGDMLRLAQHHESNDA